jgi:DNA-binding CsgD family transcriptional regulator/PAS domain-containing protein
MREAEQVSSLIGDIYDAALDSALWPPVLEKIYRFVGGSAAGLHVLDTARRTGKVFYEVGTEPGYSQLYFSKYAKFDPTGAILHVLEVGEVTSHSLHIPQAEFIESRFYKEWIEPQGWVDNVMVTLDKTATSHAGHIVFRHQRDGLADEPARQRMRLIVPHMRRAVLIGNVVDLKTTEAATFADTLDGLSAGMFLVDTRGRIVHVNANGQALLAEGSLLRSVGGKLAASDPNADQALHDVFLAAGSGDAAVGIKGIAVPLTARNGEHYVAHVLPLTSGVRRRTGANYAAVAALFVRKAALHIPTPPEVIAKTFKLTPSELRVLLAIVEVGGTPETAEALGVAETTVKTHLRRLYAKTGASRHADLVKLVAGFSSPLAG